MALTRRFWPLLQHGFIFLTIFLEMNKQYEINVHLKMFMVKLA